MWVCAVGRKTKHALREFHFIPDSFEISKLETKNSIVNVTGSWSSNTRKHFIQCEVSRFLIRCKEKLLPHFRGILVTKIRVRWSHIERESKLSTFVQAFLRSLKPGFCGLGNDNAGRSFRGQRAMAVTSEAPAGIQRSKTVCKS